MLADWFHSALWALATLRTVNPAERTVSKSSWHTMVNDVDHRLLPRLEGIRDALIRAYDTSGGSVGDLAIAMDVPAQHRAVSPRRAAPLEQEHVGGLGRLRRPAGRRRDRAGRPRRPVAAARRGGRTGPPASKSGPPPRGSPQSTRDRETPS